MDFLWPLALVFLLIVPLSILAYLWVLRRRRRYAVRYSSLALVRAALGRQSALRRHLPFAYFLVALTSLIVAFGRPVATVSLPSDQTTIILAMDVSRSMCQTDIPPNRLSAAKAAALSFIDSQGPNTQIGIVAFAGFAELVQAPTNDHEVLRVAIESLSTARRTAIGSGLLKSLDAIAEIYDQPPPGLPGTTPEAPSAPPPDAENVPYIIVLLTDGVNNAGPPPLDAAEAAAERGVRVYTIGFGTSRASGEIPLCGRGQESIDPLGPGNQGLGGGGFNRGIDEETLRRVAEITGGEYYPATSAGELHDVFEKLPAFSLVKEERMEISVFFTALGALLALAAVLLSLAWNPVP
ncbi:MAG TPA: VWA domain-containing protein [Anaerolineales bacterium]|jgi:Ca-activated chloride channel family protein